METRKDLDGRAIGLMLILCQIWGFQQVVLKATALEMAPLLQIALRSGVAALLVGGLLLWRGPRIAFTAGTWRPGLLAGVLFAVEFLLVGEGLRHTTASHLVVFLYTAPIFVALGLHWLRPAERLGALRWLGILLAFAGIVVTFWGRRPVAAAGASPTTLWGDGLALRAGMAWAADDAGGALLPTGPGLRHRDPALSTGGRLCPAAGSRRRLGPDRYSAHAAAVGQPAVSVAGSLMRQLSGLVLAAAALLGVPAGGVFLSDAAVRDRLWGGVAR